MRRTILALLLVLLPTTALAQTGPTKVGAPDSTGTLRPFKVVDLRTGAGEDWFQGVSILLPGAGGGVVVSSTDPLPVTVGAGVTLPINLAQVGGAAFAQGQRAAASSLSVVPDSGGTRWPVNPISGQTGVSGGAGASDAATTRVVIENTQGGYLQTLAGGVSGGHYQEDVLTMPACTQGTSPWVSNTTQLAGTAIAVNAGAADAGTQRVMLESGQASYLSTLAGGVSGGHYQEDVLEMPATAASGDVALPVKQVVIAGWQAATAVRAIAVDASGQLLVAGSVNAKLVNSLGGDITFPVLDGSENLDDAVSVATAASLNVRTGVATTAPVTGTTAAGVTSVDALLRDTAGASLLPPAAALADSFTNPTASQIGAMSMIWDTADGGGKWERMPGTAANGIKAVVTGSVSATLAGNNTVDLNLLAGHAIDHNAGAVGDGTQRVTLDSTQGGYLSTLAGGVSGTHYQVDIVGPLGASAAGSSLSVVQDTTGAWTQDVTKLAGHAVTHGKADVGEGVLNVNQAGHPTGQKCEDVLVTDDAEVSVLDADAGRTYATVQVAYGETDGPVVCAAGATTSVATHGLWLLPAADATHTGSSADWPGYSGQITCRTTDTDHATVNVCAW